MKTYTSASPNIHNPQPSPACARSWQRTGMSALLALAVTASMARGAPGDQWVLPVDHRDGSGWLETPGEGYDGQSSWEGFGTDPVRRIYWALNGLSIGTSHDVPTSTELYTIEWYRPASGGNDWQPIESQFHGIIGEQFPFDPSIPWAGEYGTSHQYIRASGGTPSTWVAAGPGPHTPEGSAYNCLGDSGTFMWLTKGSWLYAKWDFTFQIDHTWSALRLTQITPVTFVSATKSGANIKLIWNAIPGKTYQLQWKADLKDATWNDLVGTITATAATATNSYLIGPDPKRFYRVKLLP